MSQQGWNIFIETIVIAAISVTILIFSPKVIREGIPDMAYLALILIFVSIPVKYINQKYFSKK